MLGLSETLSPRGARRRKRRRATTGVSATASSTLLTPLVQILLASSARAWPPAAFAQAGTSFEPLEEGSGCNTTAYGEWYDSPYFGALLDDLVDFWIFPDAELTNGQVRRCGMYAAGYVMGSCVTYY